MQHPKPGRRKKCFKGTALLITSGRVHILLQMLQNVTVYFIRISPVWMGFYMHGFPVSEIKSVW